MSNLIELDSLSILAIIDNELDPITPSQNAAVQQTRNLKTIGLNGPTASNPDRHVLRMDNICCSAHGLSLMITGVKDGKEHTILFDTGPEESAWERNATRLRADIAKIEAIQLSHWHRDHSGGMLRVLRMIDEARRNGDSTHATLPAVRVDLHPARPDLRGMQPSDASIISFEPDPTFREVEEAGGLVHKSDQSHTVLDDYFLISGEIPRVMPYEKGLRAGVRYDEAVGKWQTDTTITDERFLMCKLKDRGIVVFTGCSHGGVVNCSRHAIDLGKGTPLYAVMGGFHLADAEDKQIEDTAQDLKALGISVLLPGHCTGWRSKFELHRVFPAKSLVPSFVGGQYVL
ncbi:beta-lactamase-like protein [Neohortaea acidophila]|uniref:Beta-lactamase-like protein n=1 Tax=Neohortaea acidophila TaxID=245834 RepID=A0A6A6PIQ5_9PEZI|nr:beta-lactamase-like protein [Neohortaea acidophila]KAF2479899.1 beta-lactamase-like protein [Neohortaea acidophila]